MLDRWLARTILRFSNGSIPAERIDEYTLAARGRPVAFGIWLAIEALPIVGVPLLVLGVVVKSAMLASVGVAFVALFYLRWSGVFRVTLWPLVRRASKPRDRERGSF